jgi:hypothetical protein
VQEATRLCLTRVAVRTVVATRARTGRLLGAMCPDDLLRMAGVGEPPSFRDDTPVGLLSVVALVFDGHNRPVSNEVSGRPPKGTEASRVGGP